MLLLFETIAILLLVALALAGFMAAAAWTVAIWFGDRE
jgi:hypothetical protein